jgi:hypothetical protein
LLNIRLGHAIEPGQDLAHVIGLDEFRRADLAADDERAGLQQQQRMPSHRTRGEEGGGPINRQRRRAKGGRGRDSVAVELVCAAGRRGDMT